MHVRPRMTRSAIEEARAFLSLGRFAVVGLSRDEKDFTRMVARELWKRGLDALPVHPAGGEMEGHPCVARLAELVPPVEAALLFTAPAVSTEITREAITAGVKRIWFHRGGGHGSASPEALAACAAAGVIAIEGLCPFMVLEGAAWPHRVHGWFRQRALDRRARLAARAHGPA